MAPSRTRLDRPGLVLLNVVGGVLVLASYASLFWEPPRVRSALWGGVPGSLRPFYTLNMFLAAAGYLAVFWLLVIGHTRAELERVSGWSYGIVFVVYALVLLPSALWVPLTVRMIEAPDPLLWATIRLVLSLVAIGGLGLLWLSVRFARADGRRAAWWATAGAASFALQTAVLDALVWPAHYPV